MREAGTQALIQFFEAAARAARSQLSAHTECTEGVWSGEELIHYAIQVAAREVSLGPDEFARARAIFEGLFRSHYEGCSPAEAPEILEKGAATVRASRERRAAGPGVARLVIARAKV